MSNLPIDAELQALFKDVTNGTGDKTDTRAILVQNDNGMLRLIESLPAEGSDKDDFNDVLGKLFAAEPIKPGYALYRLDSKSPAGLSEWLNCAYRPEGAKVREKMQYSLTQASLLAGLSEQHFLETVYGATAGEFSFPSKLRNSRKHDYQNPQVSTTGKSAAEAAGGGIGGARRTFETRSAAGAGQTPSSIASAPSATNGSSVASTQEARSATPEDSRPDFPSSMTEEGTSHSSMTVGKVPTPTESVGDKHLSAPNEALAPGAVERFKDTAEANAASAMAVEKRSEPAALMEEAAPAVSTNEAAAAEPAESVSSAYYKNLEKEMPDEERAAEPADIRQESSTGVTATVSSQDNEPPSGLAENKMHEPNSIPSQDHAASSTVAETSIPVTSHSASQQAASAPVSTSSIGSGRGAQGLETERERELADLKAQEQEARSSGVVGTGGPRTGLAWDEDVEPALHGLAKKGLTGSTAEWNLVVLRLDLGKEIVRLAQPPRMAMPGDVASVLAEVSHQEQTSEPCYAFFAHPNAQDEEANARRVGLIYVCPMHSTVRQRMIYSSNLASLTAHATSLGGLEIVKRLETADPADLTPEYLLESLAPSVSEDAAPSGATTYSRPKRPGRK